MCGRVGFVSPREHFDTWIDPKTPLDRAQAMLAPYAPEAMRSYPITRYVNSPGNDDPHVLDPAPPDPAADQPPSGTPA